MPMKKVAKLDNKILDRIRRCHAEENLPCQDSTLFIAWLTRKFLSAMVILSP
jgi:hypothetical protein